MPASSSRLSATSPPSIFIPVSERLKKNTYPTKGIARIIIEKPFGKDLPSSREVH